MGHHFQNTCCLFFCFQTCVAYLDEERDLRPARRLSPLHDAALPWGRGRGGRRRRPAWRPPPVRVVHQALGWPRLPGRLHAHHLHPLLLPLPFVPCHHLLHHMHLHLLSAGVFGVRGGWGAGGGGRGRGRRRGRWGRGPAPVSLLLYEGGQGRGSRDSVRLHVHVRLKFILVGGAHPLGWGRSYLGRAQLVVGGRQQVEWARRQPRLAYQKEGEKKTLPPRTLLRCELNPCQLRTAALRRWYTQHGSFETWNCQWR